MKEKSKHQREKEMSGVRPPEGYQPLAGGPEEVEERPSSVLNKLSSGVKALVTAIPVGGSHTPLDGERVSIGRTSKSDKLKQIREHLISKGE
ncbi:MAG: hypothetical protein P0S95_05610 [Rhabdochlamydiaceae bacterium]|nr:hypothetical protein [Candidatus Amphrikana amoebophyrae]